MTNFLVPTGAQEVLMSVCLSGTSWSKALNLHCSRSNLPGDTKGDSKAETKGATSLVPHKSDIAHASSNKCCFLLD